MLNINSEIQTQVFMTNSYLGFARILFVTGVHNSINCAFYCHPVVIVRLNVTYSTFYPLLILPSGARRACSICHWIRMSSFPCESLAKVILLLGMLGLYNNIYFISIAVIQSQAATLECCQNQVWCPLNLLLSLPMDSPSSADR